MTAETPTARRTFGPVVLVGVGAAALAAVAGHQPWARAHGSTAQADSALIEFATDSGPGESPAAGALALVLLACWGVVLVSRGRFRRATAGLAVLAGLGVVVLVVVGHADVPEAVRDAVAAVGVTDPDVSRTAWYWLTGAGALTSAVAAALAFAWAPAWPEMGQRYDAPARAADAATPSQPGPSERSDTELWKALDDGRDPTL